MQRSLEAFYRFFERYERVTGASFYSLRAPVKFEPLEKKEYDQVLVPNPMPKVERLRQHFLEHMDDDFNTGGAIGELYELLRELNRWADEARMEQLLPGPDDLAVDVLRRGSMVLKELSQILGLFQEPVAAAKGANDKLVGGLMQLLLDLRAEARKAKNFAVADQIRKRLTELGVTLEDRPGGTGWRVG